VKKASANVNQGIDNAEDFQFGKQVATL